MLLVQRARELDAALSRHLHVHEHDLRPAVRAQRLPHLLAAPRGGDHPDRLARLEGLPEPLAEDRMIVDDHHLDRVAHRFAEYRSAPPRPTTSTEVPARPNARTRPSDPRKMKPLAD